MDNDLSLLPALQRLLTEKNISRTADKMGLSQPAMSRIFGRLKRSFNDPLMVRSGSQYQLTPKGQRLLQRLNSLLPQVEKLWQSGELALSQVEQTVVVAGTDMDIVFLREPLNHIRRTAPRLHLAIRTGSPRIFDQLADGEVDLGLTAFDSNRAGLYRKKITEESFVVIAGKSSHYDSNNLDLNTYLSANHGIFSFAEVSRGRVDAALEAMSLERRISLSLPTFLQIPAFLSDPDLLFSVPTSFGRYLAKQFAVKLLPLPFTVQPLPIYLYWHERLHHSPLHRWLRQVIIDNESSCDENNPQD